MANDPRKRYATAAEARHLLNLVIYGAPNAPTVEPTPRFRRRATQTKAKAAVKTKAATKAKPAPKTNGATKAKAQPVRPALVPPPVRIAHPRRRRLLLGALVVAALAGGAVAGTVAAGDGETTPVGPSTITAGDLGVDLPDGWAQQPQPEGRLAAAPVGDSGSGLTIVANGKLPARADRGDAVQLGEYEAWRRDAVETGDGTEKVRYTIPTGGASAVAISCAASAGAAPNTLRLCERMASTLSLDSQEPVELQTVLDAERRWDAAAAKLSRDRAGAREKLAAASRQSGQIEVAERLARVHSADAKRFGELPGGEAVQRAATDAASAYRALAAAARSDSASAWDAARERVRSADERLAQAIAAG
jgi:hypothetical protein